MSAKMSAKPMSAKTPRLSGVALSTFIQDYCEQHHILFDVDILNDGFMKAGYVAGRAYTPDEATEILCSVAAQWHLRSASATLAILHPRNGVPPFAERN